MIYTTLLPTDRVVRLPLFLLFLQEINSDRLPLARRNPGMSEAQCMKEQRDYRPIRVIKKCRLTDPKHSQISKYVRICQSARADNPGISFGCSRSCQRLTAAAPSPGRFCLENSFWTSRPRKRQLGPPSFPLQPFPARAGGKGGSTARWRLGCLPAAR